MERRRYVVEDSPAELESRRLRALEEMNDPSTRDWLRRLGIGDGWHCLDLGAGHGSVAEWMAERVGASGRVVAVDRDPRFLGEGAAPPLERRRADVAADDLEREAFDLVHCRALLMHVADPRAVLAKMARALRPGGWLLVEEGDFGSFGAADSSHPGAGVFDRTTRACWDAMQEAGAMDGHCGRGIAGLVARLGLVETGAEGRVHVGRGGNSVSRFWSLSFRVPAIDRLIARGVVSAQDVDRVRALLADPSFEFVDATVFAAWGRRPA